MLEFSEELKKYFAKRNKATEGLKRCVTFLSFSQLLDLKCEFVQSEYYEEDGQEYEFHVFEKDEKRYVSIQVYEEREGGMYHQVLYSDDGFLPGEEATG